MGSEVFHIRNQEVPLLEDARARGQLPAVVLQPYFHQGQLVVSGQEDTERRGTSDLS